MAEITLNVTFTDEDKIADLSLKGLERETKKVLDQFAGHLREAGASKVEIKYEFDSADSQVPKADWSDWLEKADLPKEIIGAKLDISTGLAKYWSDEDEPEAVDFKNVTVTGCRVTRKMIYLDIEPVSQNGFEIVSLSCYHLHNSNLWHFDGRKIGSGIEPQGGGKVHWLIEAR